MSEVCVTGNLNADLILHPLGDFPAWGTEVVADLMSWRPGGIGNVLLCLARLGVGVSAVANVGKDFIGREMLSTLEEAGIDTSHIERSLNVPTAISVGIGREDGERAFVTHLGHLELLDIDLVLRHREAWKEAQCVLISGYLLLPSLGFKGTRTLIDEVRAEGKEIIFDWHAPSCCDALCPAPTPLLLSAGAPCRTILEAACDLQHHWALRSSMVSSSPNPVVNSVGLGRFFFDIKTSRERRKF